MSLTLIRERNRRTNEIESERVLCSVHLHEQYPEGVPSDCFVRGPRYCPMCETSTRAGECKACGMPTEKVPMPPIIEASEAPWGFRCQYDGLAPELRREDDLPCSPSL